MSETETATASSASASSPAQKTASQPARTRRESRGWLALVFQILAFAAAGVAGFAVSHYFTTQQQADAARREALAAESEASATAPLPAARSAPLVDGSVAVPPTESGVPVSGVAEAAGPDRPNDSAGDSPPGKIAPSDAEDPSADGDGSRLE